MSESGTGARLVRFYRRSEAARGLVLLSPTMAIMLTALAAPMVLLALYSFWTQDGYAVNTQPTLAQYATSLGRPTYRALFYRSIEISAAVTFITVLLAYPMAYFVAFRVEKTKFVWLILLTIPFWTSYLLRVFAWKLILGYNGVINSGPDEPGADPPAARIPALQSDRCRGDVGACLGGVRDPANLCEPGEDRPLAAGCRGRSGRRAGPALPARDAAAVAARRDRRGGADLRADDGATM
ncbi:MAG: hypothetical protein WDM81_01780 [Rhizomicrobium sp.]